MTNTIPVHFGEADQKRRHDLSRVIDRFADLAADLGDPKLTAESEKLRQKFRDARFNLVVVGEFKRGKSTFINALLGEPLLPTAVIPLTSVVTVVTYAEKRGATISFLDGRRQTVDVGAIRDYITEDRNPKNERGVQLVEIGFPAEILRAGVRIVDTPGTGSVHSHNTQATLDFLPQADALIVLLTADQPASREELDLLHEARKFAPRFFVVQNKIDYLDDEQRRESVDFLERTLKAEFDEPIRIHGISAKAALEGNSDKAGEFDRLRSDILDFLIREKGDLVLTNTAARLEKLLDDAANLISLESHMAEMSSSSIASKIDAFRAASAEITTAQREAEHLLQADISDLIKRVHADLKHFAAENREATKKAVESAFQGSRHLNNFALAKELKSVVKAEVEAAFVNWRSAQENALAESFEAITENFSRRANRVVDEITSIAVEIFGTPIAVHFNVEPLSSKSSHYYYTEDPFDFRLSRFRLLVPGRLGKEMIKDAFLWSITFEMARNAARLHGDLQQRIEQSSRDFLARFRKGVRKVIDEVAELLTLTAARLEESRSTGDSIAERHKPNQIIIADLRSALLDYRSCKPDVHNLSRS